MPIHPTSNMEGSRKYKILKITFSIFWLFMFTWLELPGANILSDTIVCLEKPVIFSNAPLCEDFTLELRTDYLEGMNYYWYDPQGNEISIVTTAIIPNISLDMAGLYRLVLEKDGCLSDTAKIQVMVNTRPPVPEVSNNGPICEGETLFLEGPTLAGASYKWIDPFGTVIGNTEDISIDNIPKELAGDYFLEITQMGCASHLGGTPVGVIPVSEPPILQTDELVCEGDTLVILTDSVPGATYLWKGPDNQVFEATEKLIIPDANLELEGTYSLELEALGCKSPEGQLIIDIFSKAKANLTGGGSICRGEPIELNIDLEGVAPFELIYSKNGIRQPPVQVEDSSFLMSLRPEFSADFHLVQLSDQNGCSAELSGQARVEVADNPVLTLLSDTVCDNNNEYYQVQLMVSEGTAPYEFNGLQGNLEENLFTSQNLPNETFYELSVKDKNGCSSELVSGQFLCPCSTNAGKIEELPIEVCGEQPAEFNIENKAQLDGNDVFYYVLHDGNTQELGNILKKSVEPFFPDYDGLDVNETYHITPIAGNPQGELVYLEDRCLSIGEGTTLVLREIPDQPIITGESNICPGASLELTAPAYEEGAVEYLWQTPNGEIRTVDPVFTEAPVTIMATGDYFLSVERHGCISDLSPSFPLRVTTPPEVADAGTDAFACGNSTILLQAQMPEEGNARWESFSSSSIIHQPSAAETSVVDLSEGVNIFYWILSTEECPDYSIDSVTITHFPKLQAMEDQLIIPENETFLDFNVLENDPMPSDHLCWTDLVSIPEEGILEDMGDGNFSFKRPSGFEGTIPFQYQLCYETAECEAICDTAMVQLQVELDPFDPGLFIPDGITPNNDGLNDRLIIEGIDNYPQNELSIFDRWGNHLYSAAPYQNNWEGTYQDQPLPEGAYYFILKTDVVEKRTLKGRIYIIR